MFKKVFRNVYVLMVIALVMFVFWANYLSNSVTNEIDGIAEHVGDTVVFDGDTTIIIDYSMWYDTYTLQDGTQVSTKLYNLD